MQSSLHWLRWPRWRRPALALLFTAPFVWATAQTWHRFADAFGTSPITRVLPPRGDAVPAVDSPRFRESLAALTQTEMRPGHRIDMLVDGPATMARLDADLQRAARSIAVQNYYCEPGRVTEWLAERLVERARAGVQVRFLRDGFGCTSLPRGWVERLRAAGVAVATLRPVHWWSLHDAMHRSHVRIVTIDDRVGYVGGFGFADKWIERDGTPGWRETAARFTGPAVAQLRGAFAIGWADATGELLVDGDPVDTNAVGTTAAMIAGAAPPASDTGAVAGVMFTQRAFGTPVPERFLALALAGARQRVYIANSYFVPNAALRRWLIAAAARGVDVRVLAPSENIDIPFTRWAGRSTFPELLRGGVRIYEYQPAMMHAKTIIIDERFASVGSLNLDNLSLRINDEAVLHVHDRVFTAAMAEQFTRDLARAREITLPVLAERSVRERMMTALARLVRDLL